MTAGEHVRKQASSERRQQEKRTPSPTQRRGGTAPRQSRQRGKNRQMRKWILICRSRAVKRGNGQQCGSAGSLRNRGDTVVPCQRVFPGPCLMLCSAFIKNNLAHTLRQHRAIHGSSQLTAQLFASFSPNCTNLLVNRSTIACVNLVCLTKNLTADLRSQNCAVLP